MPSFTFSSDVRDSTDGLLLVLRARHILVAGSPSDDTHIVKGRLPDGVDVILESDLVIALSGTVNRVPIDASDIQCSAIARHLLNYFHVNSAQLGLRPASKIFVDDTDGIAKLTLSPTRHLLRPRTAALRLSAIEILYVFKTPQPQGTSGAQPHAGLAVAADPFSPHAFLPLVAALDRTVERLVVTQLIRRYPLIFGPWRERFDAEVATSAKIARAVADIVSRSSHAEFSQRSRRLIKALRRNCAAIAKASDDALRGLLPNTRGDEVLLPSSSGSEGEFLESGDNFNILCLAMERFFKCNPKPMRYKSVLSFSAINGGPTKHIEDDDFALSDCRSDPPLDVTRLPDGHGLLLSGALDDVNIDLDLDLDADTESGVGWRFEEDDDTIDGSQVYEDDLFLRHSDGGAIMGDADIWSTHIMEPHPVPGVALDDFDDFWGSSQETLDNQAFEWCDRPQDDSQASSTDAMVPDPYPRFGRGSPEIFLADDDDDEHEHWLDGLGDAQAQLDTRRGQRFRSLAHSPERFLNSMAMDSNSSGDELSFDNPDAPGSEACSDLLELFDDIFESAVASRLPVCIGDDHAYGIGRPKTLPPFTVTCRRPEERSPDGDELSSLAALRPSSGSPDPSPASRGIAPLSVRKRSRSPETASPAGARWVIDEGAHGRNEDGLVAGHALAIRPGQEGVVEGWADWLACATRGGTRGSDREGEKGGEEDAILWDE